MIYGTKEKGNKKAHSKENQEEGSEKADSNHNSAVKWKKRKI